MRQIARKMRPARSWRSWLKRKCEGATGSLAIVAPGHGPSHPRSLHHGSRLPAMSRRGAARCWRSWYVTRLAVNRMRAGAYISFPIATPGRSVQDCGNAERGQNSAFFQDRPRGAAIKCASRSTRHSSAYRRRLLLRCGTRLGTYGFRGGKGSAVGVSATHFREGALRQPNRDLGTWLTADLLLTPRVR